MGFSVCLFNLVPATPFLLQVVQKVLIFPRKVNVSIILTGPLLSAE